MRAIMIPMIIVLIISMLADFYIIRDIRCYLSEKVRKGAVTAYAVFAVLGWILLVVVLTYPIRNTGAGLKPIMWMLFTATSIFVPKIVYALCSLTGRFINRVTKSRRRGMNYFAMAGAPLAVLVFIFMWWGALFTSNDILVNKVTVESDRLPASFDGYRIVQFSDFHLGTWGNDTSFVAGVIHKINSLHPDLIVFTGDLVSRETGEMEPFLKTLSGLRAPDGVLSVLGNHDYGDYITWKYPSERDANNALMAAWQKQIGWRLLNNKHVFITNIKDSLVLIGVENWGEPPFKQYGRLTDAYPLSRDSVHNLNDGRFKILLSHNPEHWRREVSKISNIDLTLSGHTHAMQFMFRLGDMAWSPAKYIYEQWGGLYETPVTDGVTSRIYVNIGLGEVGFPARLGAAYPEITEITLRHKSR